MLQASRNRARCRQHQIVRAAASSFSPDDPYKVLRTPVACQVASASSLCDLVSAQLQVLGLHQGADSEAVQRQYNKLKREKRGDEDAITKIENAHSSLMMRNLTARMQA